MTHLHRLSLLLALGLVLPAPLRAGDDTEELLALLSTPVNGASKREQRLMDSPQAIEVLTGEDIRRMGVHRLSDALRLMTSVDVLEVGSIGTYVSLRGVMQQGQPRTTQILVDGVPLYNAELASVDVDNLPVSLDAVDKVEVVRGPSSSLYGANAVTGVISITTKRAGGAPAGGLRAGAADKRTFWGQGDLEVGSGGFGLTAGFGGASLGISNQPTKNANTDAPVVLDADHAHQHQAYVRSEFRYGAGSFWAAGGEGYKLTNSYTGANSSGGLQRFTTRILQAGWQHRWAEAFRTEVRASRTVHLFSLGAQPSSVALDPGFAQEYRWVDYDSRLLELQFNWDLAAGLHAVGGLDRRTYSAGKAPFVGIQEPQEESARGGFLNLDWNATSTLAFSLGARRESETLGGSRTSPRFAAVWNPTPNASLRAGYYSATRSPQILESRVNFAFPSPPVMLRLLPNPDLKPEKVDSYELGYRQGLGRVTLDLTLFQMKFERLIGQTGPVITPGQPFTTVAYKSNNLGGSKDQGVELACTWSLSRVWTLGGNFTYLDYTFERTSQAPTYTPKTKGNLWARFQAGGWTAHAAWSHTAATDVEALPVVGTTKRQHRDALEQVQLSASKAFATGLSVGLYARNATREYTDQGPGGPTRSAVIYAARRELGGTVGWRF